MANRSMPDNNPQRRQPRTKREPEYRPSSGQENDSTHHPFLAPNVRLQARAACGASLCEPLFGGTRTSTGVAGELILLSAFLQSVSVITEAVVALEVSDVVSTVFRSRLGNCRRTRVSGQASSNKGTGGGDFSALAARHMCRRCKRSYVRGGRILRGSDGGIPGLARRQSLPESRGRREPVRRCFGDPLLLDAGELLGCYSDRVLYLVAGRWCSSHQGYSGLSELRAEQRRGHTLHGHSRADSPHGLADLLQTCR